MISSLVIVLVIAAIATSAYYVARRMIPEPPDYDDRSPAYEYGFPTTVAAQGRPRQFLLGYVRATGLHLYSVADLDATHHFIGWGIGPLQNLPEPMADGVPISSLDGGDATQYTGTGSQTPDPRSAHLRHLEPNGAAVDLEVWSLATDGYAPSPLPTAQTRVTVEEDGGTIRVHIQANLVHADGDRTKYLQFKVYTKAAAASSWTLSGSTYQIQQPSGQFGTMAAYVWIQGGASTQSAQGPGAFAYNDTTKVLDVGVRPGTVNAISVTDATVFDAGSYDVKVEFAKQWIGTEGVPYDTDAASGYLNLYAVEVEERNNAHAMRWLAYSAITLADKSTERRPDFTAIAAGLKAPKVWDAVGSQWWTDTWTPNPIWNAALIARHAAGMNLADGEVDWTRMQDEGAYCDEPVATHHVGTAATGSTSTSVLTQISDGEDWGGYLIEDTATGERRPIYSYDVTTGAALVTPAFSNAMAGRAFALKEQRFVVALDLDVEKDAGEACRQVLQNCRGDWRYTTEGKWCAYAGRPRTSVGTIDAGKASSADTLAVVLADTLQADWSDKSRQPDSMVIRFRDQHQNWEEDAFPIGTPTGRVDQTVEYLGCPRRSQALRLGWYAYNLPRLTWTLALGCTLSASRLEPWDVAEVKAPRFGWGYDLTDVNAITEITDVVGTAVVGTAVVRANAEAGKAFQLLSVTDAGSEDTVALSCLEYDPEIFSDDPGILLPLAQQLNFPDPFAPPDPVENLAVTNLGDKTANNIYDPNIQLDWTHPNPPSVVGYNIYLSRDSGETWQLIGYSGQATSFVAPVVGFDGTVQFKVIPLGRERSALWDDAPTGSGTAAGGLDNAVTRTTATTEDATYDITATSGAIGAVVENLPQLVEHDIIVNVPEGTISDYVTILNRGGGGSITIQATGAQASTVLYNANGPVFAIAGCTCTIRFSGFTAKYIGSAGGTLRGTSCIKVVNNPGTVVTDTIAFGRTGTYITSGYKGLEVVESESVKARVLSDAAGLTTMEYGIHVTEGTVVHDGSSAFGDTNYTVVGNGTIRQGGVI